MQKKRIILPNYAFLVTLIIINITNECNHLFITQVGEHKQHYSCHFCQSLMILSFYKSIQQMLTELTELKSFFSSHFSIRWLRSNADCHKKMAKPF